jgi:hypothetical protein
MDTKTVVTIAAVLIGGYVLLQMLAQMQAFRLSSVGDPMDANKLLEELPDQQVLNYAKNIFIARRKAGDIKPWTAAMDRAPAPAA